MVLKCAYGSFSLICSVILGGDKLYFYWMVWERKRAESSSDLSLSVVMCVIVLCLSLKNFSVDLNDVTYAFAVLDGCGSTWIYP